MPLSSVQSTGSEEHAEVTRVMIIDDSPLMCRALENILEEDPAIEVTGCAHSGREALDMLQERPCDICTLDVHMPGMNGITVLKHIMVKHPLPTLMVSAFTADGARITFDALRYGAVDFFQKPSSAGGMNMEEQADILRSKVKSAARVQVEAARYLRLKLVSHNAEGDKGAETGDMAVNIISTSTGGYSSLLSLLPSLASGLTDPVLVFMGVSGEVLGAFMDYLRSYVKFPVEKAADGQKMNAGTVYFLSRGQCAAFEQHAGAWVLNVSKRQDLPGKEGPVDLALFSASENFGAGAQAIFLSGDDGQGLTGAKELLRNGGSVLIQRPATCLSPAVPEHLLKELDGTGAREVTLSEMAEIISSGKK